MQFPHPVRLSPGATRWRLSDLEAFEAFVNGEKPPKPRSSESERYFTVKQVAERYGASVPTVWRWSAQSGEVA